MAHSNLTTAECLVVESVVLAHIAGAPYWTFEHERWILPQLGELVERGLVTWNFDNSGNFRVSPAQALIDGDEYQRVYMKFPNSHIRETA